MICWNLTNHRQCSDLLTTSRKRSGSASSWSGFEPGRRRSVFSSAQRSDQPCIPADIWAGPLEEDCSYVIRKCRTGLFKIQMASCYHSMNANQCWPPIALWHATDVHTWQGDLLVVPLNRKIMWTNHERIWSLINRIHLATCSSCWERGNNTVYQQLISGICLLL